MVLLGDGGIAGGAGYDPSGPDTPVGSRGFKSPGFVGLQVFAVDPGITTGWAWACLGRKELLETVSSSPSSGRSLASPFGLSTALAQGRVRYGQIPVIDPLDPRFGSPALASLPDAAAEGAYTHEASSMVAEMMSRNGALLRSTPQMQEVFAAYRILSAMMDCQALGNALSKGRVSHLNDLVIEDFLLRQRTVDRSLLSPVRLTARLEVAVDMEPDLAAVVSYQSAAEAKPIVTDDRLAKWGLEIKGQHARDAMRHLVLWLRKQSMR